MKKLIMIAVLAVSMISSIFAFNFSLGVKGMAGINVGTTIKDIGVDVVAATNRKPDFIWAGGAYVDLSLIGPVGLQVGANLGKNAVTLKDETGTVGIQYSELLLDVPVMIWTDLKLGPIGLGFGVGPNISFVLDSEGTIAGTDFDKEDFDINNAIWGLAAGVNAKIYFNKHVALVAGTNYVLDIQKKDVGFADVTANGVNKDTFLSFNRSVLSADLGLELKLF